MYALIANTNKVLIGTALDFEAFMIVIRGSMDLKTK